MSDASLKPSLKDLLSGVAADVQLLASQTLTLARLEVSGAASKLAWSGIALAASAFIAVAGVAVLVSALVLILIALGLPAWAAATVVGLVLTLGGALAARYFANASRQVLGLKETRQSVRETLEWLKF